MKQNKKRRKRNRAELENKLKKYMYIGQEKKSKQEKQGKNQKEKGKKLVGGTMKKREKRCLFSY